MNLDVDLDVDVDGIRGAPLSLSNSITCTATASTSTSDSRSKSRSQNRDSHAKMEFLKNYAALVWQLAPTAFPKSQGIRHGLTLRSVISLFRPHRQALLFHLDVDAAELPVALIVGRVIADAVLARQFPGYLLEGRP
jgi:hypothetical protein